MPASIQWPTQNVTAANTTRDGTGQVYQIFRATAEQTVTAIRLQPLGVNVASVARIWLNNGRDNGDPANNQLYDEIALPATASAPENDALAEIALTVTLVLPAGYRLLLTLGTAVSAGFDVVVQAT